MHSGHQPPRQRTFPGLLKPGSQEPSDYTSAVSLCGCLGQCWDRGGSWDLEQQALPLEPFTHMHTCSPSSVLHPSSTLASPPGGLGHLLAMTHPWWKFLLSPSQGFSPLKGTATPIPSAEQPQGLLAQNLYRNSAASPPSHLPDSSCQHVLVARMVERVTERMVRFGGRRSRLGEREGEPHREVGRIRR